MVNCIYFFASGRLNEDIDRIFNHAEGYMMETPRDKYLNDPKFRAIVDMMECYIAAADFTPSEMREAAVLASINYESRTRNITFNVKAKEYSRIINELNKSFKTTYK